MNNILLGIFFLILGLLFMNMFKDVCGCKDLVEGQCTDGEGRCVWNSQLCRQIGPNPIETIETLNRYCNNEGSVNIVYLEYINNFQNRMPQNSYIPDNVDGSRNWKESLCCNNSSESLPLPGGGGSGGGGGGGGGGDDENPPTGTYKLSCNNGQITFTPSPS